MNNGYNGRNRNNRYPTENRNRQSGYSQSGNYRYPNSPSDGYPRGRSTRYPGNPSDGYSRERNTRYTDSYPSGGYSGSKSTRYTDDYPSHNSSSDRRPRYPDNSSYDDYYGNRNTRRPNSPSSSGHSRGRSNFYSEDYYEDSYSERNRTNYAQRKRADQSGTLRSGSVRNHSVTRPSRDRGQSYYNAYSSKNSDEEKLPISVFIGIGVTAIAVVTLIISISVSSNKMRNRSQTYDDNLTSQTEVTSTAIIDIEDEDESDETENTVSSTPKTESFIGVWYKSGVEESQKSVFTVTMQYNDSFEFRLEIWNGKESAAISGTAFYTDETHADYSPKKNVKLSFERGSGFVNITHTGSNSSFGIGKNYSIDGKFTESEQEYSVESETSSDTAVSYDYNIYKSDAVVKALSNTLSTEDYELYKEMMKKGLKSPIDYERTKDKNGKLVNVDAELNAVKYYAHLNSKGYDMIFICSEDAKIYVLFYNSEEVIYCTNDKKYSSKMPASFQAVAKAKGIEPTYR